MTPMRIRMRKLALKTREKITTTPRKTMKREPRRAEKAAALDKSIEKELLERLKKGVYGDIYNYPFNKYNKVLDMEEKDAVSEDEDEEGPIEYVEGYEELEEEDDMEDMGDFALPGDDNTVETDDDEEDFANLSRKRKNSDKKPGKDEPGSKSKKGGKVLVEVEHEDGSKRRTRTIQ